MKGLLAEKYTCTIFGFSTSYILVRARGVDNAYASAAAPYSLGTYFGLVMPYVYNFIA